MPGSGGWSGTLPELLAASFDPAAGGVVDGAGWTPWSEIARASYRLARLMREYGVLPGERVGIQLKPGSELPVAAFGALLSGAAYVPLDPLSPSRRNAQIVQDARPALLIAERPEQLAALLAEPLLAHRPRLLLTSAEAPSSIAGIPALSLAECARYPAEPPGVALDAEALAYILFTSGSTGRPKGVAISHRAARAFVDWARSCVELGPEDRVAALTPLHFDLSVFDLYASAASGASLVIVPRQLVAFPAELAAFLARERISVLYAVPSVLVQLVQRGQLDKQALSALRAVLFAGEVFPLKHLRALMQALPQARYLNLYGPTETNVVSFHEIRQPPREDDAPTPIGKPCAGAELFALAACGAALAPGELGELYVSGPVLMQGYWTGDGQAQQGLLPDPRRAGSEAAALVYRTGDLVSVDAEGVYTWRGRCSQTIKSAGYRIEPAEVEQCLLEHPDVAQAYLLARPHPSLGSELEAVVVPALERSLSAHALQAHCAQRLPRWMVPSRVRVLADVPRTSTGKVDRNALLAEAGA